MILKGGIPGVLVKHGAFRGFVPADIPTDGDEPSPLANDFTLPAEAATEYIWCLLAALVASGTTATTDQGGYSLTGAPAGVHAQGYRLFKMPASGAPVVADFTITTTVVVLTAQRDQSIAYNVLNAVLRDQGLLYNVFNAVSRAQSIEWTVDGLLQVSRAQTIEWSVWNSVSVVQTISYSIGAGVFKDQSISYLINSPLATDVLRLRIEIAPFYKMNARS
jgi:hypothetical protein